MIVVVQVWNLFIDPGLFARRPFRNALREPVSNFFVGRLDRITSVADVAANFNAEITTNSSRSRKKNEHRERDVNPNLLPRHDTQTNSNELTPWQNQKA
jgi:hypothetical protein